MYNPPFPSSLFTSRSSRTFLLVTLIIALAIAVLPAPIQAATRKLSRVGPVEGRLRSMLVAGNLLVYQADYDEEGRFSLYSVPIAGGARVRLDAGLPPGQVLAFQVSADGTRAVFTQRRDDDGHTYLYSVPSSGGTPARLNNPSSELGSPLYNSQEVRFWIAGGSRVVYRSRAFWLHSVPIGGGQPTALSPTPPTAGSLYEVGEVQISANGALVAYTLNQGGQNHLYAIPATGGTPIQVSNTPVGVAYSDRTFTLSADGTRLFYLAPTPDPSDLIDDSMLVSVAPNGGDRRTLATGHWLRFEYHARSGRLVYSKGPFEHSDVYSIPILGGSTTIITQALRLRAFDRPWLVLSPYSNDGVFTQTFDGSIHHFSVTGSGTTQVSNVPDVPTSMVTFTADGRYVAFGAGEFLDRRLYAYPLAGGATQRIDNLGTGTVMGVWPAPSGDRVLFTANTRSYGQQMALLSVSAGGGAVTMLSDPPNSIEPFLSPPVFGPDNTAIYAAGARLIGSADNLPRYAQIYRVPIAGGVKPGRIDHGRASAHDPLGYQISPIDRRVVYFNDRDSDGVNELYSVPVGGGTPVLLFNRPEGFVISPIGRHVLVFGRSSADNVPALYMVPIGGGNPRALYRLPPNGQEVTRAEFTPNAHHIVFTTRNVAGGRALFGLSASGGEPTWIFQAGSKSEETFQITPNSTRIVFQSPYVHQDFLLSTPVAGQIWTNMYGYIGMNDRFEISPSGANVVFKLADVTGATSGLASSQIAKEFPVLITPNPVHSFAITSDSTQIVFVDQLAGEYRLRTAPIDGGTATPLASSDDQVESFTVAPTNDQVVYLTSRPGATDATRIYTLASVPITGGGPTILVGAFETGGSAVPFKISPDGGRVVYQLGQEVWSSPISGGAATRLLAGDLVTEFDFAEGGHVVMLGAEGQLFINRLAGGALRQLSPWPERVDSFKLIGAQVVYRATDGENAQSLYTADLLDVLDLGERVSLPLVR